MIVFRLSKTKFSTDLSGKGTETAGGRWNSQGVRIIYTSQSRALCTAEIAVHTPLCILPTDFSLTTLDFPDNTLICEINSGDLPKEWNKFPFSHLTQLSGDNFIKNGKYLVMKVPSAVIQGDFNYLINPVHHEIKKVRIVTIEPFEFDTRLFK